MNQDETIALWKDCQDAKKVLLDQDPDKIEHEAHKAAVAVWNKWAQGMLDEREQLEKAGEWRSEKIFSRELGENSKTRDWLKRGKVDFSNVVFIITGQTLRDLPHDDKAMPEPAKEKVKSILCEGGTINFSSFLMPSKTNFSKARFSGSSYFNSATFLGDSNFRLVIFLGISDFNSAVFLGDSNFKSMTFSSISDFNSVTFLGDSNFSSTTFSGFCNFRFAIFSGDSNFHSTIFSSDANFSKATFFRDIFFNYAEFEKVAGFLGVSFTQKASFASIISKRSFSLAEAHFSLVPDFTESDFHQPPRLDNIHIDRAGGWWSGAKVDENVSAMYRVLKRLAEDGKDHNNEIKFFAGEMRTARFNTEFPLLGDGRDRYKEANSERKEAWTKEEKVREQLDHTKPLPPFVERTAPLWPNVARFWISMFYEFFSDFGRSLWRPFLWIVLLKFVFLLYIFNHRTEEAQAWGYSSSMQQFCHNVMGPCTLPQNVARCTYTNPAHATIYLSAQYGLPFMPSSSKQKTMLAKACLFGWQSVTKPKNVSEKAKKYVAVLPDQVIFWGAVQNLLLLIFLFLFGLALRNHFRMK